MTKQCLRHREEEKGKKKVIVAQLYLGAAVACREPVVPHWDRSGINLSIYLSMTKAASCSLLLCCLKIKALPKASLACTAELFYGTYT